MVLIFFDTLFHLIVSIFPYFLVGVGTGALIQTYVPSGKLIKYLNKGLGPILNASFLGSILPGCACSTMPIARGLKSNGGSLGTVTSFVMASPLLAPQTLILTFGLLGTKFAFGRLIFAMIGSISFGLICHTFRHKIGSDFDNKDKAKHSHQGHCQHDHSVKHKTKSPTIRLFFQNFILICKDLSRFFLVGIVIAAILSSFVPNQAIAEYIGSNGVLAFLLALVIGIPLYVCEGEEIPITLSLVSIGLGQGPAMTFLLCSVGTCIPTLLMAKSVIGKKPMLLYAAYWFPFAFISGLIFQAI